MQTSQPTWLVRNSDRLKTVMRIVFGIVWLVDGLFKFQPGLADQLPEMVLSAGQRQPAWLQPWFNLWYTQVSTNPALLVNLTGTFEVALGLALIFGFMRKIAYIGGFILSLFI